MNATAEDHGNDLQAQIEEVEALSSIYGDEWCVIDEASRIFCIRVSDDALQPKLTLCLQIILPADYPSSAPPVYQINGAWLRGRDRAMLSNSLEEIYLERAGESLLYLWVEKVREFLLQRSLSSEAPETTEEEGPRDASEEDLPDVSGLKLSQLPPQLSSEAKAKDAPLIKHGETITDRRSSFQPHLAAVESLKQVQMVLSSLYENKKIASATHNIYAFRICCEDKNTVLQDCEDDGETAAGGRLLHLLQILDVSNVLVVVSRWYGGILLGPDRFKHINNCARNILLQEGYTHAPDETGGKSKKVKGKKTK